MISNHPGWTEDIKRNLYPKLETDLEVDVAIIGGGLTGILTAYQLTKAGKKVTVLEKKKIGDGATEYTTAFITGVIDTDFLDLTEMFGAQKARMIWNSGFDGLCLLEKIINEEKIECEFKRCSAFSYATSQEDASHLKEIAQNAKAINFNVSFSQDSLNFKNLGFLEIKDQAKFHPLKFLNSLAKKAQEKGALIFEQTEVLEIFEDNPVIIKTKENTIKAHYGIIATYEPLNNPVETLLKNGLYISYILEAKIPKNKLKEGIYWDLESPYHYFRVDPQENYDRLILGGEDHRTELKISPEKNYQALEKYLKKIMPDLEYEVVRQWNGPIMETVDGLPFIGRMIKNDYHLVATGFSGNGMTYAPIAAQIFHDIIFGINNPWISLYNAKRIPTVFQLIKKGTDYSKVLYGGAIKKLLEID